MDTLADLTDQLPAPLIANIPPPPPPPPPAMPPNGLPAGTKAKTLSVFGEVEVKPSPKGNPLAEAIKKSKLKKTAGPVIKGMDSGLGQSPPATPKFGDSIRKHYSHSQAEAILHIESVKPLGRHPANYRTIEINVGETGKPILLAMIAHPEKYGSAFGDGVSPDKGIDYRAAMTKLHTAGFHTLVAFEKEQTALMSDRFESAGHEISTLTGKPIDSKYELIHMEDFTKPKMADMKRVHQLVVEASKKGHNIAFYCGAGFGRSGVMAAGVVLIENLLSMAKADKLTKAPQTKTDKTTNIDFQEVTTTHEVRLAVDTVRREDPETGYDLREFNARASEKGPTVEKEGQFEALEELEADIRATYGK